MKQRHTHWIGILWMAFLIGCLLPKMAGAEEEGKATVELYVTCSPGQDSLQVNNNSDFSVHLLRPHPATGGTQTYPLKRITKLEEGTYQIVFKSNKYILNHIFLDGQAIPLDRDGRFLTLAKGAHHRLLLQIKPSEKITTLISAFAKPKNFSGRLLLNLQDRSTVDFGDGASISDVSTLNPVFITPNGFGPNERLIPDMTKQAQVESIQPDQKSLSVTLDNSKTQQTVYTAVQRTDQVPEILQAQIGSKELLVRTSHTEIQRAILWIQGIPLGKEDLTLTTYKKGFATIRLKKPLSMEDTIQLVTIDPDGYYSNWSRQTTATSAANALSVTVDSPVGGDQKLHLHASQTGVTATVWINGEPIQHHASVEHIFPEGATKYDVTLKKPLEKGDEIIVKIQKGQQQGWALTKVDRRLADRIIALAGADRIQTAIAISQAAFPAGSKASTVVLAASTGRDHGPSPDALTAGPLAAQYQAPVLLIETNRIPMEVEREIERLGATHILLLGGKDVIRHNVELQLKAKDLKVQRVAGEDRFETSAKIAETMMRKDATIHQAVLANGITLIDALAAAPYAIQEHAPILLTPFDQWQESVQRVLDSKRIDKVDIVGGTGTISSRMARDLEDKLGMRFNGENRYDTAAQIANNLRERRTLIIASGIQSVDALAAAPLAAQQQGIILLTQSDQLPEETVTFLKNAGTFENIYTVGGAQSIGYGVTRAIQKLFDL